jgi:dTDP-4-dehydrorhamnose 3,5-epimerase
MGKFHFEKTPLEGVYIVEPTLFPDARGSFMETYQQKEFENAGLNMNFVQDNESYSRRGTLRALHFQIKHPQGKLVRVTEGEVFDAVVDIHRSSPTFGKWFGLVLSGENRKQLYIPTGFAHGFLVLSEHARFLYKCTDYYYADDQGGFLWNDPDVGVQWPTEDIEEFFLSEKDKNLPLLRDLKF